MFSPSMFYNYRSDHTITLPNNTELVLLDVNLKFYTFIPTHLYLRSLSHIYTPFYLRKNCPSILKKYFWIEIAVLNSPKIVNTIGITDIKFNTDIQI